MNDSSPNDPRFGDPQPNITRQLSPSDWERAELELQSEPIPPRERLFSRKVLVGWALFAVAIYFGVGIIRTVIRESIKTSISTMSDQIPRDKTTIFRSRNGNITISRDKRGGPITITKTEPGTGKPPTTVTIQGSGVMVTTPPTPNPNPNPNPTPTAPSPPPASPTKR